MPADAKPVRRRRQVALKYGVLAILAALAFVSAIAVNRTVFPLFSGDDDDAVYVLQAETLRQGDLTLPAADQREFFRPWLTGLHEDRLVFPFQHGWPAVLALSSLVFGSMRLALGLTAAGVVVMCFLLARELVASRAKALLASAFVLASPFFVVQSGTYLNYMFTLLLDLTFGFLVVRGLRRSSRPLLAGAGLVLGLALLTRPYDAVLVTLPFALYGMYVYRKEPRRLAAAAGLVFAGIAGPLLVLLVLNRHLTGDPLSFPEAVNGGIQSFGFGPRRIAEGTPIVDYGVGTALDALATNLRALPKWLFGGVVAIGVAVWALARRRMGAAGWLLAGVAVVFPVGYVFWWGSELSVEGRDTVGPHYYLPVMVPVAILAAEGLVEIFRRRRLVGVLLGIAMVGVTAVAVPVTRDEVDAVHDAFARGDDTISEADLDGAIVLLPRAPDERPYVLHPLPYLGNPPDLDASVLYATDRGGKDFDLLDRYRDRALYRFGFSLPEGAGQFRSEPLLVRLTRTSARAMAVRMTFTNPSGDAPIVTAYLGTGGRIVQAETVDRASARGSEYEATWVIADRSAQLVTGSGAAPVVALPERGRLVFGVGFGKTVELDADRFERRVPYDGEDDVELLLPGDAWHRWTYPTRFWLREHGERVIRELAAEPAG
jgi:hypothetical protein